MDKELREKLSVEAERMEEQVKQVKQEIDEKRKKYRELKKDLRIINRLVGHEEEIAVKKSKKRHIAEEAKLEAISI